MPATALAVLDVADDQERKGNARAADGLDPRTFLNYCEDVHDQPEWRRTADKEADYYDGNQIDAGTLRALEERGMGPLISNLIQPTINVVLGMEAKTRTDWRLTAEDDSGLEVAEALNTKLHEAEHKSRADRACSEGYAGQVKVGIGWVEVSKQADPFKFPIRVVSPHRRELFWDWRDRSQDLQEGRYLIRRRWYDLDEAKVYFPRHADVLEAAGTGFGENWLNRTTESVELAQAFQQDRGWSLEEFEYRDTIRRRICLYEAWYRQLRRGYVLRLRDGRAVEMNLDNPLHAMAVARGMARPTAAIYSKWGTAIFAGPHKVMDLGCREKRHPYIPFLGYREDLTGIPYGLIRSMISPQDEVNARRRKLLWLLSAVRLLIDSDALDDRYNSIEDALREVSRPDAAIVLNPNRVNKSGAVQIDSNLPLATQQEQVMLRAEEMIQKVAGVFNAMLGRESASTSGVAIDSLVEQGSTVLAEINDNYRFARRLVGESIVDLIRSDIGRDQVEVMVGEDPKRRKIVLLNKPSQDAQYGLPVVENDVQRSRVKVILDDVPSTPTYRQQQFRLLADVVKSLSPEVQALMTPYLFEASDLPKRQEMAQVVRAALNLPTVDGQQDPQVMGLMQQVQALQQQLAQAAAALEDKQGREDREIKLKERELDIKERAEDNRAREAEQRAALAEAKVQETDARVEVMRAEQARKDVEFALTQAVQQLGQTVTEVQGNVQQVAGKVETTRGESGEQSKQLAQALKELRGALDKLQSDAGSQVESVREALSGELKKVIEAEEKRTAEIEKTVAKAIADAAETIRQRQDEMAAALREELGRGRTLKGVKWAKDAEGNITGGEAQYDDGARAFEIKRGRAGDPTRIEFEDE